MTYAKTQILRSLRAAFAADKDAVLLALGVLDDRREDEVNFWCVFERGSVYVGLVGGWTQRRLGASWEEAVSCAERFREKIESAAAA